MPEDTHHSLLKEMLIESWISILPRELSKLCNADIKIKNTIGKLAKTSTLHQHIHNSQVVTKANVKGQVTSDVFLINSLSDAISISGLVLKLAKEDIQNKISQSLFDDGDSEAFHKVMDIAVDAMTQKWKVATKTEVSVLVEECKVIDFSKDEDRLTLGYTETNLLLMQEELVISDFPSSLMFEFIPIELAVKLSRLLGKNPIVDIEQFIGQRIGISYEELGATDEEKKEAARKVILIVEDTAPVRKIISYFLQEEGFISIEAESAERALSILGNERIDAILLDIMMPDMDGFTFCEKVRANPIASKIPVIICSARGTKDVVVHAMKLGAKDYIVKPFVKSTVIEKLKKVIK